MRTRGLPLLLLGPSVAGASEDAWSLATRAASFLGAWVLLSFVAVGLVALWFRARARANERLSARIRREDWLAASETGVEMEPRTRRG